MIVLEQIRAHPWLAGGAVGVALLFIILRHNAAGGGSEVATGGDATDNSLGVAQLQSQVQLAGINASAQASAAHDDATLHALMLQQSSVDLASTLGAEVRLSEIGASADVAKQTNSLSAQVAIANLNTQQQLAQIQSNTVITTNAQLVNVLNQQTQATKEIATQSWWDKTFG